MKIGELRDLSVSYVINKFDLMKKTVITNWSVKEKFTFICKIKLRKISGPNNTEQCYQSYIIHYPPPPAPPTPPPPPPKK